MVTSESVGERREKRPPPIDSAKQALPATSALAGVLLAAVEFICYTSPLVKEKVCDIDALIPSTFDHLKT